MNKRHLITATGRRQFLFFIIFSLIFTAVVPTKAMAETDQIESEVESSDRSRTYDGVGYSIRYDICEEWSTGFTAEISITNTSDKQIENWRLKANSSNSHITLWNAQLESRKDGTTVIKNAGHNADIAPGQKVVFGFSSSETFVGFPDDITLISEESELEKEDFKASYKLVNDWKDGFSGEIEITNSSDSAIEDWGIEFDFGRDITNIWNAQIVSHDGDHYVIRNAGYDSDIKSGESVSFGFNGTGGDQDTEPTGYRLTHYGNTGKKDEITIHFDPVIEGVTDIPKDIRVKAGESVAEPEEEPQSENAIFLGWFTDKEGEEYFDFETEKPESDMTLYAGWFDLDNEVDTDGDGLTDQLEELLLTDPLTADTDSDGIDDYTEINLTMTDPILPDSDGDGTDDGDNDTDSDGLTDAQEIVKGTSPVNPDSDGDSLEDGEEVNTYGTDPLKADTDGDGADDATEIRYGFDPLVKNDSFDATAKATGKVTASARLTVNGEQLNTLSVEADENPTLFPDDMPGYIGEAYDFHVDGTFDKAELTFEFDKALLDDPQFDPVIYYFNEDEQELEELDTVVKGNVASTTVTHFSTYVLLNRKEFNDTINSFLTDVWEAGDYKAVETVFVIDDSGSMTWNDKSYDRLQVAKELTEGLPSSGKAGVVSFANNTQILTDQLTSDKEEVKKYLDRKCFSSYGGTYMYSAIDSAMDLFGEDSADTLRLEIILTDGDAFDTEKHSSVIKRAQQKNIKLYTVGLGSSTWYFNHYLKPLAEETGGEFYMAAKAAGLKDIYDSIGKSIDLSVDSDGDGIPDYYEDNLVAFNGKRILTDKNNADTDGDGLSDGEEVEIKVKEYGKQAVVFGKYNSNPTSGDSDGDGLNDGTAQYIGGFTEVAPKDPDKLHKNGTKALWDAHVRSQIEDGTVSTYAKKPSAKSLTEEIITDLKHKQGFRYQVVKNGVRVNKKHIAKILKAISENGPVNKNKSLANFLINVGVYLDSPIKKSSKGIKELIKASMSVARSYLSDNTMADVGAYILNFVKDTEGKAFHSQVDTWQKDFGYNSMYDTVFGAATSMARLPILFQYKNTDYALWLWKGNYLNLNSGGEIGLYKDRKKTGNSKIPHYASIETAKMSLSLYKESGSTFQNIYNWDPGVQWWITGFSGARKEFKNPKASSLKIIAHVYLEDLCDSCFQVAKQNYKKNFIKDGNTLWIVW